ncbi:hypothetical protein JTB14_017414 [Gonioctena quinquepunctata]|nr:hypothetical protein JTB14_017414 [Gonioctena quinquepunctata]
MKKIYSKQDKVSNVLRYFLLREFDINNDNVKDLWKKMSDEDKKVFNFDIDSIDLHGYFENMVMGMKKFILKEDINKLKLHKERYKRLTFLHYMMKYSFFGLAIYSLHKCLTSSVIRRKK